MRYRHLADMILIFFNDGSVISAAETFSCTVSKQHRSKNIVSRIWSCSQVEMSQVTVLQSTFAPGLCPFTTDLLATEYTGQCQKRYLLACGNTKLAE